MKAGEEVIRGTHVLRKASALTRPPGCPSTHGSSWPSWQRLGTIIEKLRVFFTERRSLARRGSGTSLAAQEGVSMMEWKYTKGLCFVAYWSPTVARPVGSAVPKAGCPQVAGSRVGMLPMSSM